MPLPDLTPGSQSDLSVVPLSCRRNGTLSLMGTSELRAEGVPPAAGWASGGWAQGLRPQGPGSTRLGLFTLQGSCFVFPQLSAASFWKIPAWLSCAEDGKCQKLESVRAPVVGARRGPGRRRWEANKGRRPGVGGTRGSRSAPPQSCLGRTSAGAGLAVTRLWLRREAFPQGKTHTPPPSPARATPTLSRPRGHFQSVHKTGPERTSRVLRGEALGTPST